MKKATFTTCSNCGLHGPEGELAKEALDRAAELGWLVGDRPHSRDDYCPACRSEFAPRMCTVRHVGKQSTAIYELTTGNGAVPVCGVHQSQVLKELFASGAASVTVTRTGVARRPRTWV